MRDEAGQSSCACREPRSACCGLTHPSSGEGRTLREGWCLARRNLAFLPPYAAVGRGKSRRLDVEGVLSIPPFDADHGELRPAHFRLFQAGATGELHRPALEASALHGRVSMTLAAHRARAHAGVADLGDRPVTSVSPDGYFLGVSPKCGPTASTTKSRRIVDRRDISQRPIGPTPGADIISRARLSCPPSPAHVSQTCRISSKTVAPKAAPSRRSRGSDVRRRVRGCATRSVSASSPHLQPETA